MAIKLTDANAATGSLEKTSTLIFTAGAAFAPKVIKNGRVPNQIVCSGVLCITPFITNKFIPTGGDINPNSTTITAKIPNQTGCMPASSITG